MPDKKCDTEEIVKQLRVLDGLKQLRDNMGPKFLESFPELSNIDSRLDDMITEQENLLEAKVAECGNIDSDELPEDLVSEPESA